MREGVPLEGYHREPLACQMVRGGASHAANPKYDNVLCRRQNASPRRATAQPRLQGIPNAEPGDLAKLPQTHAAVQGGGRDGIMPGKSS